MEKFCVIRNIYRSIVEYESQFEKLYHISLNEGMLLCSLAENGRLSSGEIASLLGLTASNTSKVIKASERKELIHRILGNTDKRQMYFSLTAEGHKKIIELKNSNINIPEHLIDIIDKI